MHERAEAQKERGKEAVDNIEETRGGRSGGGVKPWADTVNRVLPPPRGSWPETIHSRGNLEDGTNERFSVSASNCE